MVKDSSVPEVVILRLPLYIRALSQMSEEGQNVISSKTLGKKGRINISNVLNQLSYSFKFKKKIDTFLDKDKLVNYY